MKSTIGSPTNYEEILASFGPDQLKTRYHLVSAPRSTIASKQSGLYTCDAAMGAGYAYISKMLDSVHVLPW